MNKNNENNLTPILISVVPDLVGGQGHVIDYHQAVGKAAKLIGYKHLVATAPDEMISHLPDNWNTCLNSDKLEWETYTIFKIFKIKSIYDWAIRLAKYLRQEAMPNSEYGVIFLERFVLSHLLAVILTLFFIPRNNLSVLLLYRRDIHNQKNRFAYKFLNNLIRSMLPTKNFRLITDSELLSKSLSNYFDMPVDIVPIPHTEIVCEEDIFTKQSKEILCWWVGSPREEKGLDIIKSFASSACENADQICLLVAESSRISTVLGGVNVKTLQDCLTRTEYLKWLVACDVCLMPYNSFDYRERTSGIFAECVIAGKIPVVSSNTWMAFELAKYKLEELIIEWSNPNTTMEQIIGFTKDIDIKAKLNHMQKEYKEFHSLQGYANQINIILKS
ncbi:MULTISPECIES: glycosyltransferase [Pseudanabaena]|uniref:Glycosyl transferase group 1 n=2 Tax=Pseudanabaena TaxID=1152 RepID=L8N487_9CYAN|nr:MULTISPECIES: glycosyltransferase [Pseudanabaena]ELS33058.1 hypothetical protein Pse7429DRAFT_1692 [Pseudanabaena biceps PCC 7429]MDG3494708.1 glycosyltransferase [Pseudanabaena catenata USMAC16]